jgi:TonB family protein
MNARSITRPLCTLIVALALVAPAGWAQSSATRHSTPQAAQAPQKNERIAEEKTGSFVVRDGQRLRLTSDMGNIRIRTQNSGQVSYRVRVEADAGQPDAHIYLSKFMFSALRMPGGVFLHARVPWREFRGHLWVNFELNVPRNFQLEVSTQSGNIETEDIDGRVVLATGGGNITAGRVGGAARLDTQGGHILVQDVAADLSASSAGGHITAGNVQGDAIIRTAGGHIRVASVQGTAQLETGGGNISLERAGAGIIAHTNGGRIDLGEASGTIRASTGGGNIGVLNVVGTTQLDSGGGSICLTKVQGAIRASTATGTITAFFIPEGKLLGPSHLESGAGDILVYIPRELAISIEATVESPEGGLLSGTDADSENLQAARALKKTARIIADPGIPLKLTRVSTGTSGNVVRGEAALNGGGEVLRLKTATGRIRLRYSGSPVVAASGAPNAEASTDIGYANYEPSVELLRQQIEVRLKTPREELARQLAQQAQDLVKQQQLQQVQARVAERESLREVSRLQALQRKIYSLWTGRMRVESGEQKQRLIKSVSPAYPSFAREQRLEGFVRLDVYISAEGVVEEVKVLKGSGLFALAAVDAVKQWRYAPLLADGKAVPVVTTVDLDFRIR